jgi:D-alanine--poly(phosphoribitol) ligase subunit 1
MYRTGDLVRVDPGDGRLHILGRKDNQIKHMGYRIELEEIEAAMHCLDYVSEAAAIHVNDGRYSRIIAVLAGDRSVGDERIRADLRHLLPEYMVPTAFFREEVLPKNANGKVDRRQIAERHGA